MKSVEIGPTTFVIFGITGDLAKLKIIIAFMDLFAGGFLHGYINKLSIRESLEKGTEMSSKIIQKIGARLS